MTMDVLRASWKAILAFASVFVAQLIENLASSSGAVFLPQTAGEWLRVLGTAFIGAVAVYLARNRLNEKQVEKALTKDLPPEAVQRVVKNVTNPEG